MEQSIIETINKIIKGRNIFLIGMMACGKSQTGPRLAKLLNYKYIDLDSLIENLLNKSINQIFKDEGENSFREIETQCLKETIKIPSLVISTGGGIVNKHENWGILRQGIVIWIDIKNEIAIKRLSKDKKTRPLLQGKDLNNSYKDIFNSRKNLYSQADLIIQVNEENVDQVAKKIVFAIHNKINN